MWGQQLHGNGAGDSGDRPEQQREPAAAAEKSAQQGEPLIFHVFGDEALCRRAETEVDHTADQEHPGPGIDVDPEFETAHPPRQQDLRHEGDRRADHPDEESRTREAPHQRRVAAVGKERVRPRDRAVNLPAPGNGRRQAQGIAPKAAPRNMPRRAPERTRRVLGTDRCHEDLCTAPSETRATQALLARKR